MAVIGDPKKRGPYLIDIPYVVTGLTHHLTFQVATDTPYVVGTDPSDIGLVTKDGAGISLEDAMTDFWFIAQDILPTSATVSQYYLWRMQAGTDKKFYQASGPLSGAPAGGTITFARQATITFRSANSGFGRLVFFEAPFAGEPLIPITPNLLSTDPLEKMAGWVIDGRSPMLATDASWFMQALTVGFTQNEAIYKRRYRQQ